MLIEHRPRTAEKPEHERHDEEQVRRVAEVHDVDAALPAHLQREPSGVPQGHRVFAQVAKWSARRRAQRIAQDAHAVDRRFALRVLFGSLRTDNGDLIARVCQSAAFLPDPSVERHRQVLDQDQDVSPHFFSRQHVGQQFLVLPRCVLDPEFALDTRPPALAEPDT